MAEKDAVWQQIRTEYITKGTSYRKLAEQYGVNVTNIAKKASAEKWVTQRKQYANKTQSETLKKISDQQAERAVRLFAASDLLLDNVVTLLQKQEALRADAMKDVSVILKNIKDIQMIRTEADLREQEARIENLRRQADRGEDKESRIEVVFSAGPEDWNA